jgi:hypothetical protein
MKSGLAFLRSISSTVFNRRQKSCHSSRTARHRRFLMESMETRLLLSVDPLASVILPDVTDPAYAAVETHAYIDPVSTEFINSASIGETYGPVETDTIDTVTPSENSLTLEVEDSPVALAGLFSLSLDDETISPADALTNDNAGATGTANFTQSETAVLAFGNTVLVAFNDSGSRAGGTNKGTGFAISNDGGTTFTDGGTLPTNPGGDGGDPVLARNETTGRVYFATLGPGVGTIQMFRSDDNGTTWMSPVNATPGGSGEDKPWFTVDNFAGPGNGNVYVVSRRFGGTTPGIYFFRSTDHGETFGPSGGSLMVTGSQGAFVAVGTDHSVYVFWWAGPTLQMRKSTDQGLTFGAPVTVASGLFASGDLGLTGLRQGTATASGFRSNEFPHAAVNPVNGNIYVTYNNDAPGVDKGDVFVVQSTDQGLTWSAPIKVNDDLTTTDQWQPTVAVSTTGDKLGIFYSSRQEDPTGNNLFKYYGRIGTISGATLAFSTPSFAISDTASLPEFGRDTLVNPVYMGDYNTAHATPGFFHVSWSDNRDDLPGGAARKDPNVYYRAIDLGLTVLTTSPFAGAVVSGVPVDYVAHFSDPIEGATVNAADFRVDGVSANSLRSTLIAHRSRYRDCIR